MDWTWIVTGFSLVGTVANLYKRGWCFWVWAATNAVWTGVHLAVDMYPQAALFGVYTGLSIWGIAKWR